MKKILFVAVAALSLGGVAACKKKSGNEMMAKLEETVKKVCECKDSKCATDVTTAYGKEMADWAQKNPSAIAEAAKDEEGNKKGAELSKKMTDCMTKLATDAAGAAGGGMAGDKPAGDKPAGDKPAGDKPADGSAAGMAGDKPAGDKPADGSADKPADGSAK